MYLLSRHVRVCQSGVHIIDTCAAPKVPRPRIRRIHRRPCVLPSPDEPKDRSAARGDIYCTCIVEDAGVEGGETEEDDRAGGKSNAGVGKVESGSRNYPF
jgi:hypothetical protein